MPTSFTFPPIFFGIRPLPKHARLADVGGNDGPLFLQSMGSKKVKGVGLGVLVGCGVVVAVGLCVGIGVGKNGFGEHIISAGKHGGNVWNGGNVGSILLFTGGGMVSTYNLGLCLRKAYKVLDNHHTMDIRLGYRLVDTNH